MNGVHDMGGLECFGPIAPETEAGRFHEPWEARVLGLTLAMGATGSWNLDQSRSARESLPPEFYLSAGYYRIWYAALVQLLQAHDLLTSEELATGRADPDRVSKAVRRVLKGSDVDAVLAAGAPVDRPPRKHACFSLGDQVRVRNRHTRHHTRLPAYIRGHVGTVARVHGCHVFPDAHAVGDGECPEWLYNIRFEAAELWGEARGQAGSVRVDCWEPYLDAI